MATAVKTERITILGTPRFKAFLQREAQREGTSVSELVRQRCEQKSNDADDILLAALVDEVQKSTERAAKSLADGLAQATQVLAELRSRHGDH